MRYAIVIEKGEKSFGAYVPDLPGCVAIGKSEEEVRRLIAEAIAVWPGDSDPESLSPEKACSTKGPSVIADF